MAEPSWPGCRERDALLAAPSGTAVRPGGRGPRAARPARPQRRQLLPAAVREVAETVFGVPVSLGTAAALEQEMRQALAAAAVKYADETGWKRAGQRRWLWAAATRALAFFVITAGRGWAGVSAAGCRFAERLLTVVQSLRLQGRRVVGYLYEALVAHRAGLPTPSLLPAD